VARSKHENAWRSPPTETAAALPAPLPAALPAPSSRLHALVRLFAAQDLVLLVYLAVARLLVGLAPASAVQASCARQVEVCAAIVLAGVAAARVIPGLPGLARALAYRLALVVVLAWDYAVLGDLLPLIRPDSVDAALLRIDLAIFHVSPTLWLERLNHRPVIEYFSFFYFGYFFLCFGYMLTVTFILPTERRLSEFALGTLLIYTTAQLLYLAVPAYGPSQYLKSTFHAPLDGGFFWSLARGAVEAGGTSGPLKDVFPSMHTGGPTWLALFAVGQAKRDRRWRIPAIATVFIAANIVASTLILRWHYAIDVIAGLALAFGGSRVAVILVGAEERLRARLGLGDVWPAHGRWWWGRREG
jgi:hypothetical protein